MDSDAQSQVLATMAIMILIFQQLPAHDLLQSQRVCRGWAELIQTTSSLQKALFFEPDDEAVQRDNPLLQKAFVNFFPSTVYHNYRSSPINCIRLPFAIQARTEKLEHYLRPEASWRQMLTRQPPVYSVGRFSKNAASFTSNKGDFIRGERMDEGLRMVQLFDLVNELSARDLARSAVRLTFAHSFLMNVVSRATEPSEEAEINEVWMQVDLAIWYH